MIVVACHPEVVPDRFFDLDATREVTEVIGMTGISDRIQPERVIDLAGLRSGDLGHPSSTRENREMERRSQCLILNRLNLLFADSERLFYCSFLILSSPQITITSEAPVEKAIVMFGAFAIFDRKSSRS